MYTSSYEKLMHKFIHQTDTYRVKKCRLKHSEIQERPQITPFRAQQQAKQNLDYSGVLHGKIKNTHHLLVLLQK